MRIVFIISEQTKINIVHSYKFCGTYFFFSDGGWSSWSAIRWTTACSTTCDSGIKHGQRTRTCTNPIPVNGGKTCLGSSTIKVTDTCKDRDCPPGKYCMREA